MAQAKASFQNMKSILTNKRMSLGVRKRVLQCYIEPILLYGCESWSMTKQTLTSIEAMEMWFLRRMLRVSWTEKRTNLNTARSTRKLISNVKRRQAELLGHVMRKGKLEHLLTTGKIEGKRSRGRQRKKNTRRYSSLAGKKHCGDVCGCKRSRKVEGHDRLCLQQTRQLKKKNQVDICWFNVEVRLACPLTCPSYRGQEKQHSCELHQPNKIGLLGARKHLPARRQWSNRFRHLGNLDWCLVLRKCLVWCCFVCFVCLYAGPSGLVL